LFALKRPIARGVNQTASIYDNPDQEFEIQPARSPYSYDIANAKRIEQRSARLAVQGTIKP